jgi:hypothetical protein
VGSGNDGWAGRAFGLTLAGTLQLEGVVPAAPVRRPDTRLARTPRAAVNARWRAATPRTLLERRLNDGSVGLSVARDDALGFRVWAPRHGCFLISPDGREVLAAPPSGPAWRWERLVLAQVLPLAAVLRGLDVLHASAVAIEGRAVAFLGASGAGKTTLAAHLAARGARLVTDDVLAVDLARGRVRAHRGGALVRIDPRELRDLEGLGPVRARGEKWHVAPEPAPDRLQLALTYHLRRATGIEDIEIVAVRPYDPALLLGNAFLPYLRDPARLTRQLEISAAIARDTPLFQVRAGPAHAPAKIAAAVLEHARSVL